MQNQGGLMRNEQSRPLQQNQSIAYKAYLQKVASQLKQTN